MKLRIKEICKEKGILFKDLAGKIGVTDVGLRKSIQGNPTLESLEKIASALEVEIVDLFDQGSDKTVIVCPNCGKQITLCIKE